MSLRQVWTVGHVGPSSASPTRPLDPQELRYSTGGLAERVLEPVSILLGSTSSCASDDNSSESDSSDAQGAPMTMVAIAPVGAAPSIDAALTAGLAEYEAAEVAHYNDPRYNSLMNAPVCLPAIPEADCDSSVDLGTGVDTAPAGLAVGVRSGERDAT